MKLRLKELRIAKGLTQHQVAEMAGISQSYYTELELGRKQINANRMVQLTGVFGVNPSEIIAETSNTTFRRQDSSLAESLNALTPDDLQLVSNLVRRLAG